MDQAEYFAMSASARAQYDAQQASINGGQAGVGNAFGTAGHAIAIINEIHSLRATHASAVECLRVVANNIQDHSSIMAHDWLREHGSMT